MKPPRPEFDIDRVRADFPGLAQEVNGKPLVYFDNAATGQKPRVVLDAIAHSNTYDCANVHRGVHTLSARATTAYEAVRPRVQRFVNAGDSAEIIFTRGTTESINLVAQAYGPTVVGPGDEIVFSVLDHHSNLVPWQMLAEARGARTRVIPADERGVLDLDAYQQLLSPRTKIVALSHVSNALGTIHPLSEMIALAKRVGATTVVDGAQAAPHLPIDVLSLGCDFYAFSGHKMFGPTGIGVLYGRRALLEAMPPWQGGGDMIKKVTLEKTTYNELPYKFEAGTPNIAGVIGLGAAVDYLETLGRETIAARERDLLHYGREALASVPGLRILGTGPEKAAVFSMVLDGIHPHDAGSILDRLGIAIRTGHHCTEPLMERYGVPGTARASLAFYNTTAEIDRLVEGLHKVIALCR